MEDPPGEKIPEPEEAQPLSDELLPDREKILLELYAECDAEKAKAMSKEARAGMENAGANLVYAELDIASMHSILNLLKTGYGPLFVGQGVFVDLGSGVGKAAVAAALLHPFQKVVGIECLAPLNAVASDVQGKFAAAAATVLEEGKTPPEVSFMTGDFVDEVAGSLAPIAAECKVALAVATCYLEPQLKAMAKICCCDAREFDLYHFWPAAPSLNGIGRGLGISQRGIHGDVVGAFNLFHLQKAGTHGPGRD